MMTSKNLIPNVHAIPEERRLARLARAGDTAAFLQLYDAYSDDLYRYIYFRVMSDLAAEAMMASIFRRAWDALDAYSKDAPSFVAWLYGIARGQVLAYYQYNLKSRNFNMGFLSVAADYGLDREHGEGPNAQAWRHHLRVLAPDAQQSRLQTTTALVMEKYLDYLNPRRVHTPSPTFNSYTRPWLMRYMHFHPRHPRQSVVVERLSTLYVQLSRSLQLPAQAQGRIPRLPRMALAYAILMGALLVTGTASAQSALPGETLYGWKRTSEQAWLSVSPDPVGTELILVDRRLDEWVAVKEDPGRSASALQDYESALADLSAAMRDGSEARVESLIEAHKQILKNSGLSSLEVADYLEAAINPTPTLVATGTPLISGLAAATQTATDFIAAVTATLIDLPPTATDMPTATSTATEIPPTATDMPTATPTDTEVPPTATDIPTATDTPTATPTDTEVPPTATESPTEFAPTEIITGTPDAILFGSP